MPTKGRLHNASLGCSTANRNTTPAAEHGWCAGTTQQCAFEGRRACVAAFFGRGVWGTGSICSHITLMHNCKCMRVCAA